MFHYDVHSPCIGKGSSVTVEQAPKLCSEDYLCQQDPHKYSLTEDNRRQLKNGGLIGLARDGHLVLGSYNGQGQPWKSEEYDACNGTYLDDNSYVYVSTMTPPYTIGCWGPAAKSCEVDWNVKHMTASQMDVLELEIAYYLSLREEFKEDLGKE